MANEMTAFSAIQHLEDQTLTGDLNMEEVNQVRTAISDHLIPKVDTPTRLLIIDNCGPRLDWTPDFVEDKLNRLYRTEGGSEAYIFRPSEIPGADVWINKEIKSRCLVWFSTDLLVIVEPKESRPRLVWQSVLASTPDYQNDAIILKHTYPYELNPQKCPEFCEGLDGHDRHFSWQRFDKLGEICSEIYETAL